MRKRIIWASVVATVVGAGGAVSATPYEIFAVYERTGTAGPREVPVRGGMVLPDLADGHRLKAIRLRFNDKGVSGTGVAAFDAVQVRLRVSDEPERSLRFDARSIGGEPRDLLVWNDVVGEREKSVHVELDVKGTFSPEFLCAEEASLRESETGESFAHIVALDDIQRTLRAAWLRYDTALNSDRSDKPESTQIHAYIAVPGATDDGATKAPHDAPRASKQSKELAEATEEFDKAKKKWLDAVETERRLEEERRLHHLDRCLLPSRKLVEKNSGTEILYSFCSRDCVNWAGIAKDETSPRRFGLGRFTDAAGLEAAHRDALVALLLKKGTTLSRAKGVEYASVSEPGAPSDPRASKSVVVSDGLSFSVLRTGNLFELTEEQDAIRPGITTVLDQGSRVALRARNSSEKTCPDVQRAGFVYRLQRDDDKAPVTAKTKFRDGCAIVLEVNLKEYLDKDVTLSVAYPFPGDPDPVPVFLTRFRVANLGVITTFPVISEIVSAARGTSLDDIEASSSIPMSFTLRFREGSSGFDPGPVGITFPWRIGYNPRSEPDLARYFGLFAHVSLLFEKNEMDEVSPVVAVGAGVYAFQAFHFALAVTRQGDRYLLVGVDIQDIVKLF